MHKIAIPMTSGMPLYELAVALEVFAGSPPDFAVPWWYDVRLCMVGAGPVRTDVGLLFDGTSTLNDLMSADTVIVPACADTQGDPPPELVQALQVAFERGARIASICTGAFTLAAAGLLDQCRVTTHWMYIGELVRRWPNIHVETNVLYTDDGQILTSAGASAGMDLCLHIVRRDHGVRVANAIARRIVTPPHREGGQAQYIERPLPARDDSQLGALFDWARANLHLPLSVHDMSREALMSPRSFARKFRESTGTTPLQWLVHERVRLAQDLLENTDIPIDHVATRCGLGSAQTLRTHFFRVNQVTPYEYRRTFRMQS